MEPSLGGPPTALHTPLLGRSPTSSEMALWAGAWPTGWQRHLGFLREPGLGGSACLAAGPDVTVAGQGAEALG